MGSPRAHAPNQAFEVVVKNTGSTGKIKRVVDTRGDSMARRRIENLVPSDFVAEDQRVDIAGQSGLSEDGRRDSTDDNAADFLQT